MIPPHLTPAEAEACLAEAERQQIVRHARERAELRRRIRSGWVRPGLYFMAWWSLIGLVAWLALRYG